MSAPRTKRQFAGASADPAQRQITSFFGARSSDHVSSIEPSRHPLLPSSIQSNLLSVGMRVRKSVPEGYKTASTSAFKLWTDNTPIVSPKPASTGMRSSSTELMPFCGINRVGGFDSQPDFHFDDEDNEDDVPALDAIPELTLSQESVEDREPSRKRVFAEDESVSLQPLAWSQPKSWDEEVSPRSLASVGPGNARVMAVPRSRTRKGSALKNLGQENMAVDRDFEEAPFLVFGGGAEMDTTG